jgi:hypothetical protein
MRENYLACGNPDRCTDHPIVTIALPKLFKLQTPWSYTFVLIYGWSLAVVVPTFLGHWWTRPHTTMNEGLRPRTADLFFRYAFERKGASFEELITLFCRTEEIKEEVRHVRHKFSFRTLPDESATVHCSIINLEANGKDIEIAESLVYAHLKRKSIPFPVLEDLQSRILLHFRTLVQHLFGFVTEAKYSEAILNSIYLLQQIHQANFPGTRAEIPKCSEYAMAKVQLNDLIFQGCAEDGLVETNSTVSFSCQAKLLSPTGPLTVWQPTFCGSTLQRQPAHTPLFPMVHTP